ncbi:DUF2180 family protein [Cellulomonas sp. SG140]|uniref:DUF2180 family protein n=1 Tax=Cellulomonas sp. SG140 TaxID=2976536 RepID=UPI0021E946A1|nr:DUF2180 family protein [Cellulomonas sp. SG140]
MQCFECMTRGSQFTPAVAVCTTCGAGLCIDHAVVGHAATWLSTPGNPAPRRLPGRRLLCPECASGSSGVGDDQHDRRTVAAVS